MSYLKTLDLSKEPFSNSPDPAMFCRTTQHERCLNLLEAAVRLHRGLNIVLGKPGLGKTTISRCLIQMLTEGENNDITPILLLDPYFEEPTEFLRVLLSLMSIEPEDANDIWKLKEQVKSALFDMAQERKRVPVLLIDEGQKITTDCLEIVRELLNYETADSKLLQVVIFAQPELAEKLRSMPNLMDRINSIYNLEPLNFAQTRQFIRHRLEASAASFSTLSMFTYIAMWVIYRRSGGYPRRIVQICHKCLLEVLMRGRKKVDLITVLSLQNDTLPKKRRSSPILIGAALLALLAALPFATSLDKQFPSVNMPELPELPESSSIIDPVTDVVSKSWEGIVLWTEETLSGLSSDEEPQQATSLMEGLDGKEQAPEPELAQEQSSAPEPAEQAATTAAQKDATKTGTSADGAKPVAALEALTKIAQKQQAENASRKKMADRTATGPSAKEGKSESAGKQPSAELPGKQKAGGTESAGKKSTTKQPASKQSAAQKSTIEKAKQQATASVTKTGTDKAPATAPKVPAQPEAAAVAATAKEDQQTPPSAKAVGKPDAVTAEKKPEPTKSEPAAPQATPTPSATANNKKKADPADSTETALAGIPELSRTDSETDDNSVDPAAELAKLILAKAEKRDASQGTSSSKAGKAQKAAKPRKFSNVLTKPINVEKQNTLTQLRSELGITADDLEPPLTEPIVYNTSVPPILGTVPMTRQTFLSEILANLYGQFRTVMLGQVRTINPELKSLDSIPAGYDIYIPILPKAESRLLPGWFFFAESTNLQEVHDYMAKVKKEGLPITFRLKKGASPFVYRLARPRRLEANLYPSFGEDQ